MGAEVDDAGRERGDLSRVAWINEMKRREILPEEFDEAADKQIAALDAFNRMPARETSAVHDLQELAAMAVERINRAARS